MTKNKAKGLKKGQGSPGGSNLAMEVGSSASPPAVIKCVFVEPSLQEFLQEDGSAPNSPDWLRTYVDDWFGTHRDKFPDVVCEDLVGRITPKNASSFGEISLSKGLVTVELKSNVSSKGLMGQVAAANGQVLNFEEKLEALVRQVGELRAQLAVVRAEDVERLEREVEGFKSKVRELELENREIKLEHGEIKLEHGEIKLEHGEIKLEHGEIKSKVRELELENRGVRGILKTGVQLANKVKKRNTLNLARLEVAKGVERSKRDGEGWSAFFQSFTNSDWKKVGISDQLVINLLADGAYDLDKNVHETNAVEVVGRITSMQHGSERRAWEKLFEIAFKQSPNDLIFKE